MTWRVWENDRILWISVQNENRRKTVHTYTALSHKIAALMIMVGMMSAPNMWSEPVRFQPTRSNHQHRLDWNSRH